MLPLLWYKYFVRHFKVNIKVCYTLDFNSIKVQWQVSYSIIEMYIGKCTWIIKKQNRYYTHFANRDWTEVITI